MLELFEVLYNHPRFKKFFTTESDVMEFFLALAFILLGIEILFRLSGQNFIILRHAIPTNFFGILFAIQGFSQFAAWNEDSMYSRRNLAFTGMLAWFVLGLIQLFNTSTPILNFIQWETVVGLCSSVWVYFRLGMGKTK